MASPAPIYPVLLCGGTGTRLWPVSRKSYPKQFIELTGEQSLFQMAAQRFYDAGKVQPTIVTSEDYRFIVTQQLDAIDVAPEAILIEPSGKNTAAAIAAAALSLEAKDQEALMLVMPCDHVIEDVAQFRRAVEAGALEAQNGQMVTFGIRPTRPETGYGWLELSQKPDADFTPQPQQLRSFVEKPDLAKATELLAGGTHLWNAGIFLFSIKTILQAFETYCPDLLSGVRAAYDKAKPDLAFTRLDRAAWQGVESISIDYAIMEKASNISVVPFGGHWSDLGDWQAVWRQSATPQQDTVLHGQVTAIDCEGSLLYSSGDQQEIVGIGLKDMVAVAMPDAVLVAHKSRAQEVKQAVEALKAKQKPQAEQLPREYRPWGWYESIAMGERFQVKCIHVYPGAALSLQKHFHRAEHWIVVAGTAKVTIDEKVSIVAENESTYIPLGAVHRLENPGKVPLILIEVQTGSYLGEDDIVRFDDKYARN